MPRQAKFALSGAVAGMLLLIVTWLLAFHVTAFRNADQSIFSGFFQLHSRGHVWAVANAIAHLCDPQPFVILVAVIVAVALARRRPRAAIAIGAIVIGANVTTQLLKPLLAEPRAANLLGGVSPLAAASWPSGHATAAMSLALCSVIAAPARRRPTVAVVGALFAVAVSYSFLTLGWHYPSDVFGGFLIVACWTLVAVAGVFTLEARRPRRPARQPGERVSLREALAPSAVAVAGVLVLAGLVALARPHQVFSYARAHEAFMVGAAAIALLGLALAIGLMLALRRSEQQQQQHEGAI